MVSMQILSHRGYWNTPATNNSMASFARSFVKGFGTETDLRDQDGTLVISHDPPTRESLPARRFFDLAREHNRLPLALNIKADGLAPLLNDALGDDLLLRAFVFDMAVPDMRSYLDSAIRVFTRQSEVEIVPSWVDECQGVWMDSFGPEWYDASNIERHLDAGRDVCIVSSELHGREPEKLWSMLRRYHSTEHVYLCTDRPETASIFLEIS